MVNDRIEVWVQTVSRTAPGGGPSSSAAAARSGGQGRGAPRHGGKERWRIGLTMRGPPAAACGAW